MLLTVIALYAILLFVEWPGSWLFDPDEARNAEIPQSMLASGDFLTPKLNGSNYFEKPPLLYWLNTLSMKAFGDTPFAARLPVRLATVGMVFLLLFGRKGIPPGANLWAAAVFLSSLLPFSLGRINLTDGIVSFGLTWTLLSMREVLLAPEEGSPATTAVFGIWLGAAIAVLAKGLIGIVLPGLILLAWAGIMSRWKPVRRILFSKALILFVLATIPWFFLMEKAHPEFLRIFFIREHVFRYFTNGANRPGSIGYFVPVFFLGLMPWTLYFFPAIRCLCTPNWKELRKHPNELFFGLWFFVIFLFFSFSHSKLIPYLLPAFPAAAALVGLFLVKYKPERRILLWTMAGWSSLALFGIAFAQKSGFMSRYGLWPHVALILVATIGGNAIGVWRARKRIWEGPLWMALGWAGFYLALISVIPVIARDYSQHDLVLKASESGAEKIVAYRTFVHSFPLVLKNPVPVADHRDELASDGIISPELFWIRERFWTSWNSKERMVAIFRKDAREEFEAQAKKPFFLGENRKFVLASNYDPKNQSPVLHGQASGL